jgi:hypothetical protein
MIVIDAGVAMVRAKVFLKDKEGVRIRQMRRAKNANSVKI